MGSIIASSVLPKSVYVCFFSYFILNFAVLYRSTNCFNNTKRKKKEDRIVLIECHIKLWNFANALIRNKQFYWWYLDNFSLFRDGNRKENSSILLMGERQIYNAESKYNWIAQRTENRSFKYCWCHICCLKSSSIWSICMNYANENVVMGETRCIRHVLTFCK